ncbi:MAG: O-acetylhomoserine aminocarboxypropyltransferase/cysteine synthase [Desulfuromonadaceae bacterium]|nr:O-acetylhomoserine aminocarboxypropyltransferase/cysteine synthase [Desulfuromonadaceae bacterium]
MINPNWKTDTLAIQGGYRPKATEPRIVPITQSTTYKYDKADHIASLFDLDCADHMYTRMSNPTWAAFEAKMAQLEGGVGALAASSGQAAISMAILNICSNGQHIVCANTLYGGTHSLFHNTFSKMGISVTSVDPNASVEDIKACFTPETRLIFAESIGNPGLNVLDFEKFAMVAKQMQVPLIIDNTFPTPYLCRPLKLGANIVVHSATKYIDGHATSIGGVIVDGGTFKWTADKYPEMTEPDPSYHGLRYAEKFGAMAYIVKARVQLLRDLGMSLGPMNAFMFNHGLETLHVRMERHCTNAMQVAEFLERHPKVNWVSYPGLESHPSYPLACKYLPKGSSGVLTFGIKGGAEAGRRFMEATQLIAMVVHVGDVRSCVLHPASTTHRQLSTEEQLASGVLPDLIRLSVGIEHIDDILADIEQALAKS